MWGHGCPHHVKDEVVGHAVRAVYMYAGMTDIAAIQRDSAYLEAVNKLWENMVQKKCISQVELVPVAMGNPSEKIMNSPT